MHKCTALLLCLACVAPSALTAQDAPAWSARAGIERQTMANDFSVSENWLLIHAGVQRRGEWGAAALELFRSRRFSRTDEGGAAEVYLETWERSYAFARVQVVTDAEVLPSSDVRLEIFQGFADGWEASAGARRLMVVDEAIDVFGASLAKYLPSWYLRSRVDVSSSFDEPSVFYGALARRYFEAMEGVLELSGGAGDEIAEVAAGPVVDIRQAKALGLRGEAYPWRSLGLAASLSYVDFEDLPVRLGGGLTVIARW